MSVKYIRTVGWLCEIERNLWCEADDDTATVMFFLSGRDKSGQSNLQIFNHNQTPSTRSEKFLRYKRRNSLARTSAALHKEPLEGNN
jgi:hypothetical protein